MSGSGWRDARSGGKKLESGMSLLEMHQVSGGHIQECSPLITVPEHRLRIVPSI